MSMILPALRAEFPVNMKYLCGSAASLTILFKLFTHFLLDRKFPLCRLCALTFRVDLTDSLQGITLKLANWGRREDGYHRVKRCRMMVLGFSSGVCERQSSVDKADSLGIWQYEPLRPFNAGS